MERVTRADVAALAGVSPALVSYVLNGGPRSVSAGARARIEAAIAELHYEPNLVARSLRTGSSESVALLLPSATNPFFGELATALESQLRAIGYVLYVGYTWDDAQQERRYLETMRARQVDGVFIASMRDPSSVLGRYDIPVVALDRALATMSVSTVVVDNAGGVRSVLEHLMADGATRIGCIGGRRGTATADARVTAWREFVTDHSCGSSKALRRVDFTEAGGFVAARELMSSSSRSLDALFVSSDVQALGAMRALADAGISVPHDLLLASFDGSTRSRFYVPSLTCLEQPVESIAAAAVKEFQRRLDDRETVARHIQLPGFLRLGSSCGHIADPLQS